MKAISHADVMACADYAALVPALEQNHRAPPPMVERLLLEDGGSAAGDGFLIWPAWLPGKALGAKLVTVFPQNGEDGPPTVQAVYALFDGRDGTPLAMIDGTALTYVKTASDSALGAHYLARADAATLLMVGAGALAPHLVRAHRAIRPGLERVLVWNRTGGKAESLAAMLTQEGMDARATDDLEAAAGDADVISCATMAEAPLIRGAWLKDGAHLDLVGGYTAAMRESDDGAVARARIFVDTRWFTLKQAGDICQPIAAGVIAQADVLADLFDLAGGRHRGRETPDEITLFKNAGGAHLDLFTALAIYRSSGGTSA